MEKLGLLVAAFGTAQDLEQQKAICEEIAALHVASDDQRERKEAGVFLSERIADEEEHGAIVLEALAGLVHPDARHTNVDTAMRLEDFCTDPTGRNREIIELAAKRHAIQPETLIYDTPA